MNPTKAKCLTILVVAACVCVEWTRFTGTVKSVDLKKSTVTIQIKGGDILTIPVDYQVKIIEKHDESRDLKHLELDEKITLINTPSDQPKQESFEDMNSKK